MIHRHQHPAIRASLKIRESQVNPIPNTINPPVRNMWLVTQRKPLESVEPWRPLRWLLRKYFAWRGFAARDYDGRSYASIEYRGVFDDEAMARWAANCEGGAYKPIPLNAALPVETVQYQPGDVPQSEASPWYRRGVALPFKAIPREQVNAQLERLRLLEGRFDTLDNCIEGRCLEAKRVVQ